MKKTLVLVLIVFMASTALFAEAGVGGWGRMIVGVNGPDSGDPYMEIGPNWGGDGRVRHDVFGNADDVGFRAEVDGNPNASTAPGPYENATFTVGEFLYVYAKPVDILKISAGKFQIDTMRGGMGGAHGAGRHYFNMDLEDLLFSRQRTADGLGLELTPVEGVDIVTLLSPGPSGVDGPATATLEEVGKAIQIGGQYKIEGIGRVRAQYLGELAYAQYNLTNSEMFEVAFEYTGMEGLKADLGYKYDLSDNELGSVVTVAAQYSVDKINAMAAAEFDLFDDFAANFFVRGIYTLEGGYSARLEVAYQMAEDDARVSLNPYIQKGLANGKMNLGFLYENQMDNEVSTWQIPLLIEYWF